MLLRDLAEEHPLVRLTDDALTAAELIAEQRRPGVAVADACVSELEGRTVEELLPPKEKRHELPKVSGAADSHLLDAIVAASGEPA